jgi:hypothetical protein
MSNKTLKRNVRMLDTAALASVRKPFASPPARAPVRGAYLDPNVLRAYTNAATHRSDTYVPPAATYAQNAPFYPNAPTAPGPGSLRYKLASEDPRHIAPAESRVVVRKRKNTRRYKK